MIITYVGVIGYILVAAYVISRISTKKDKEVKTAIRKEATL